MSIPHDFVTLLDRPTDMEEWIAAFCARRAAKPPVEPPFPALVARQSAADWLIEQFDLLSTLPGARDRLREVIVRLIITHGGRRASLETSDQIVGTLLEVAGTLQFAEIAPSLAKWARQSWLRERHVYRLGKTEFPLRRRVWTLLLAWGAVDGLIPHLTAELADLARSAEPGTAQVAFVALGERAPAQALRLIPETARVWHEAYWESAVHEFLRVVGPRVLLTPEYESAWAECLGPCLYDDAIYNFVRPPRPYAEVDPRRPFRIFAVLKRAGIELKELPEGFAELRGEGVRLRVNVSRYLAMWSAVNVIPDTPKPVLVM
jgi:hypothetical protein